MGGAGGTERYIAKRWGAVQRLKYLPFLGFLVVGLGSPARHFPKICGGIFLQFFFQFSFEKRRFRSISRTTDFGRLVPLPFGAEEGLRKGLLSDAPFGQFCLAAYLPKGMPLAMHHLLVLARGAESYMAKRRDSGRAERYIAKHCRRQRSKRRSP